MNRVPLQISLDAAKKVKLCVNCKYYIPPLSIRNGHVPDKKHGFCKKSGTIHVVDGEITYKNVEVTREYTCRGDWYEENKQQSKYEPLDFISY